MSGIFKSVKKTIKKVGKVIKKIAPYLLIAAAVYFGGAYLMSSGAPSAGAAGSVGTSFTKAGGVGKAFLSGMGNGTASQSAAAYAEASYQASLGTNALPLSGQVAAGTSAVNALSNMGSTADAVSAGVDLARSAWTQSGHNVNLMQNIVQDAQDSARTLIDNAAKAGTSPLTSFQQQAFERSQDQLLDSGNVLAQEGDPDLYRQWATQQGLMGDSAASISQKAAQDHSMGRDMYQDAGAQAVLDQSGGPNLVNKGAGGLDAPRNTTGSERMYAATDKLMEVMLQGQADSRAYNQQILESRNKIATQQMWMQGTGMLLSAIGASEDTLEEKKDKRKMAWKPSGKEEYASGAGKIYPGGLLS